MNGKVEQILINHCITLGNIANFLDIFNKIGYARLYNYHLYHKYIDKCGNVLYLIIKIIQYP